MQHDNRLLEDIFEMFRSTDEWNEWRQLVDEVPYDFEDCKEHIKREKIRTSNQKVKSKPKPFSRRMRRTQSR